MLYFIPHSTLYILYVMSNVYIQHLQVSSLTVIVVVTFERVCVSGCMSCFVSSISCELSHFVLTAIL